jgi:acetyl esterase/lipase
VADDRLIEYDRITDRNDTRWAHPALEEFYYIDGRSTVNRLTNPEKTPEKRLESRNKMYRDIEAGRPLVFEYAPELDEHGETTTYTVPGCPEEPDAQVRVDVRAPKHRKRKKLPVIFYIAGGAFVLGTPWLGPIEEYSMNYNCVVVAPWYRTSVDARYPAAINDFHAAYQWMIENAEMLGIDSDKVVISGMSAGASLALSFVFRLKRYGYRPRGVVALDPAVTDDRSGYPSHRYHSDAWDGEQIHRTMMQYFGPDNYASSAVGPEGAANHALPKDCRGLCPVVIHSSESDADRDSLMAFMSKLYEAGVYAELHVWAGCCHATLYNAPKDNEIRERYQQIVDGNFKDFFRYDMRREWLDDTDGTTTKEDVDGT